jgi:hypothetical protein
MSLRLPCAANWVMPVAKLTRGLLSTGLRRRQELVLSGSWARLPASSPLRTVHGSFDPHGSSLCKGISRHPVSQRYFRQTNDFYGNRDGVLEDYSLRPIRLRFFSRYNEHPKGCPS